MFGLDVYKEFGLVELSLYFMLEIEDQMIQNHSAPRFGKYCTFCRHEMKVELNSTIKWLHLVWWNCLFLYMELSFAHNMFLLCYVQKSVV